MILPPCFDFDGQSVAADESGVVNLLILGISCSFTGTLPYQNERAVSLGTAKLRPYAPLYAPIRPYAPRRAPT